MAKDQELRGRLATPLKAVADSTAILTMEIWKITKVIIPDCQNHVLLTQTNQFVQLKEHLQEW